MTAASTNQALDDGWVLDEAPAPSPAPIARAIPALALVAAPREELRSAPPESALDDGWCLDDGWAIDEPSTAASPAPAAAPEPVLTLVAVTDAPAELAEPAWIDEGDGWPFEGDERAPTMQLTAEEEAFFASGDDLAVAAPPPVDMFDDLAAGPAPSFWQRLLRRSR